MPAMACSSGKQVCGKICFLLPTRMYLLNNPGEFTVLLPYQILALVQRETADGRFCGFFLLPRNYQL